MKRIAGWLLAVVCLMGGYSCGGSKKSGTTQHEDSDTAQYITLKTRHEEASKEDMDEHRKEPQAETANKHSAIFKTKNKYITWASQDYDADMTCDLNGDGRADETLSFEVDHRRSAMPVGLWYRRGDVSQDFLPGISEMLGDLWDEIDAEYVYFEMTYYDFDKDAVPELVISVQDAGSAFMRAFVYRWTAKDARAPWQYLAGIGGQSYMYIDDVGDVVAPLGSQGLYYCYRFDGKEFVEVDSSFSN